MNDIKNRGPLPLLGDESHKEMVNNLRNIVAMLTKPSAIIVISAHWEEDKPTITVSANPSLIYDY
jgi:aromatic ring-opening dioxygenase catalytic subunit (LigB family)